MHNATAKFGITGLQSRTLSYIYFLGKDGNVFQKDIEKAFNIRRSTASELIKKLEEKDYIKRESVIGDARLKKLLLTNLGITLHNKIQQVIKDNELQLGDILTEKEKKDFIVTMGKIKEVLLEKESKQI
jgi:DNA-binding MarR family transcriptional regulator